MASSDWTPRERRTEGAMYLSVAFVLVVVGTLARTVVLNWVVGPGFVVIGVVLVSAVLDRRRAPR